MKGRRGRLPPSKPDCRCIWMRPEFDEVAGTVAGAAPLFAFVTRGRLALGYVKRASLQRTPLPSVERGGPSCASARDYLGRRCC